MRDTGEPYRPVPVETVFGQSDVVLLGPDGDGREEGADGRRPVREGRRLLAGLPGRPARTRAAATRSGSTGSPRASRRPPTPTSSGSRASSRLQYWFYYPFNDWNNKHESDWEMIQLDFDAATADKALSADPVARRLLAARGAESASWDEAKLEKRDGASGRLPGRRLARQPVRPVALPRAQRPDRVRL